ncbi:MAG TPA: flagellar hook protein FlgE [Stellaceae bacterium]|nr:flagellar hook protein FlgE [Stellaceae bacterium]
MSIFGALGAAVSGLAANSNALGIISDNISNSNTIGYKDTSTDFRTLVTTSGSPSLYSPGGVESSAMYNVSQQGVLQAESSPTDLAISGGGFFVVNSSAAGGSNGATTYTRAGNFSVDANGNLVNAAGLYLQGQPLTAAEAAQVQAGNYNVLSTTTPSLLQTVNVSNNAGSAQQTSNVSLVANLPASGGGTNPTMTVPVYDSLGVQHNMTLTFTPTGTANQWTVAASFTGAGTSTATIAAGDNTIQFNTDGTLNTAGTTFNTAGALSIAWDPTITGGTSPQPVNFNLGANGTSSGLSQIGTSFTVGQINQDGVQFGNFSGVTINQSGIVTANYDNGLTRPIYILPIGTFSDPNGLQPQSGNTYSETTSSGSAVLREAGTGSAGAIAPSSLEDSTVDIATEFSNLIVTQRAYEANSKIITTADQMLQTLIQAKQ